MAQEIADSKLIDTWASSGLIVEPDISKIIEGWQLGEQPPHEYMNWLQNTFGSKLNHILKNGVASWNNTTQYLAGSSVQYNGNIWLCKVDNTNSEPTDANANWKRIITVESLTTVLDGYVKNTGNETIGGVKTFSSSPIVPTPTTTGNVISMGNIIEKTVAAIGYGAGAGGSVTQLTSKSTNVTLNKPTGQITMNNASLASNTWVGFAVINSNVTSSDTIIVNVVAGSTVMNFYEVNARPQDGSIAIDIRHSYPVSLTDAISINFAVVKGANS